MDWISKIWLGLMVFHFQQYFSYIGGQFYWWRKLEYPEKTTDLLPISKMSLLDLLGICY